MNHISLGALFVFVCSFATALSTSIIKFSTPKGSGYPGVHRVRQGFPFVFQELEVDGKDGAIVNTTPSDKAFNVKAFAIDCLLALVTATTVTWLWKTQPERRRWGIFSWLFNKKEMRELDILLNDGSCRTLR